MKIKNYILVFVLCTWSLCTFSQEYARLGERTILGTARYVGFGGAMSAIGGDPSAVHDNPAGLGLYRRAEVMITLAETLDRTQAVSGNYTAFRPTFSADQASVALSMPSYNPSEQGIQFNNVLFSYHRLRTFNRDIYFTDTDQPSLGCLLSTLQDVNWDIPFCSDANNVSSSLQINESGQVNEFAIDWGMNISNKWFVGAGIHFQQLTYVSDAVFIETFMQTNENRQHMSNHNKSSLVFSGASVSGALGVILRPTGWLRLGAGLQTASIGGLQTYSAGTLTALTDSVRDSYAPDMNYSSSDFHMPWHLSSSAAFQIGAYGMIALQYDMYHQKNEPEWHSLRAGFEVIPVLGLYINAGYAYESTFKDDRSIWRVDESFNRQDTHFQHPLGAHNASLAIGYRGTHVLVQAAYQYHRQGLRLWAHENADSRIVNTDTHRIILTIGWHQSY